ncbi:MAG: DNA-deoxyinosine glycosylase [Clostridia bacterium]|nr:DNA-deoxyinosine glycosylase [Clostridia bacterium]
MEQLTHTFAPVYNRDSRVLILGSFPSVKSREQGFYYGHPQNRFWRVLSAITGEPLPDGIEDKRALLLKHHIALWDVCASCEIEGSSDASIRGVIPNDIATILAGTKIKRILLNGKTAAKLFERLIRPSLAFEGGVVPLPSTSPANAGMKLDALIEAWGAWMKNEKKG